MFGGILLGMSLFVKNFRSSFNDTINNKANDMKKVQEERKRKQRGAVDANEEK